MNVVSPRQSKSSKREAGSISEGEMYACFSALSRISKAISGLRDLDAILKAGLDNIFEIMKDSVGGIMLFDKQTRLLYYHLHHKLSPRIISHMRLISGEGIAGKVAFTGQPMLIEDVTLESETAHPDIIVKEGFHSCISVPLRARGNVVGVINVINTMQSKFSKSDFLMLQAIGDQLGLAIEQANLYEQLRSGRERYRELSRRVITTQEEERRKVANNLQDKTSDKITALAATLQSLVTVSEKIETDEIDFKLKLKQSHALASEIAMELNSMIESLRPPFMDTLGIIQAIRHYVETNVIPSGIEVSFHLEYDGADLPIEIATRLFRVVQGVIGNIIQHSKAKNASISMQRYDDDLVLRISDDGRGFDAGQFTRIQENGRGAGLFSIKEHTRLLGGRCAVQSSPGQGTHVTITIPLAKNPENIENQNITA